MCVSIPAQIVSVSAAALPMAQVEVAGRTETCCLAYTPTAQVGDYVLVSNGFAVELMDPQSAAESLAAFAELGLLEPATPGGLQMTLPSQTDPMSRITAPNPDQG